MKNFLFDFCVKIRKISNIIYRTDNICLHEYKFHKLSTMYRCQNILKRKCYEHNNYKISIDIQ